MKWLGRAALIVLSTLTVLALAEGTLRWLGAEIPAGRLWHTQYLHRPDPDLIFSLRPEAQASWQTDEFLEVVHINPQGLRSPEFVKKGTRPRILILGDSMTFGHGVGDEDPYPQRLQEILDSRGESVEVINAAIRGYSSDQSYKLFATRLRALDPDLVIFGHYWNDIHENVFQALYVFEGERLVELDPTRHVLYRVGRLGEELPAAMLPLRLTRLLFSSLLSLGSEQLDPSVYDNKPIAWSRQKFLLLMRNLQRMSREDGFALLVLAIPHRDGARDRYQWMGQLEEMGVSFLDVHAHPVWKRRAAELFFLKDDHLTQTGHRNLAIQLHRYLQQSGLIPREPAESGEG
jgi:hypothetical protein